MKTVTVKVMGAPAKVIEDTTVETVQGFIELMGLTGNYTANLGGSPAELTTTVPNGGFLILSPAVKGA